MTNENETVVRIEGLSKIFCDFWRRPKVRAVNNISFDIRRGEIFGLLGPNGSGKSTTIKMLLGLLNPSAGSISIFDKPPKDTAVKEKIGYLPEESYLYNYLTPRETLTFYGSLFKISSNEIRARTDQLINMVGLSQASGRHVGEFSKGMARRTGIAQALINNPDLVILDEPTSGLDPIGCRQVKDLILDLARSGKTIILSSHLLADVEDICDRILILFNGEIKAQGKVKQLLQKQEIVRLSSAGIDPDTLKQLTDAFRKHTGKDPLIDHPSMNLEEYFIDVIEKAHKDSALSSGVSKSTGTAEFLKERK